MLFLARFPGLSSHAKLILLAMWVTSAEGDSVFGNFSEGESVFGNTTKLGNFTSFYMNAGIYSPGEAVPNIYMSRKSFDEMKRTESYYTLSKAYSFVDGGMLSTAFAGDSELDFFEESNQAWKLAHDAEAAYASGETLAAMELGITSPFFPFLVCMNSIDEKDPRSGYERLQVLAERFSDIGADIKNPEKAAKKMV